MTIQLTAILLMQAGEGAEAAERGLTAFSLTFMLVSMAAVTALAAWSFSRIMRGRRHFDPDGTGPARPPVEGKVDREGGV
jgi:hypothetical protein